MENDAENQSESYSVKSHNSMHSYMGSEMDVHNSRAFNTFSGPMTENKRKKKQKGNKPKLLDSDNFAAKRYQLQLNMFSLVKDIVECESPTRTNQILTVNKDVLRQNAIKKLALRDQAKGFVTDVNSMVQKKTGRLNRKTLNIVSHADLGLLDRNELYDVVHCEPEVVEVKDSDFDEDYLKQLNKLKEDKEMVEVRKIEKIKIKAGEMEGNNSHIYRKESTVQDNQSIKNERKSFLSTKKSEFYKTKEIFEKEESKSESSKHVILPVEEDFAPKIDIGEEEIQTVDHRLQQTTSSLNSRHRNTKGFSEKESCKCGNNTGVCRLCPKCRNRDCVSPLHQTQDKNYFTLSPQKVKAGPKEKISRVKLNNYDNAAKKVYLGFGVEDINKPKQGILPVLRDLEIHGYIPRKGYHVFNNNQPVSQGKVYYIKNPLHRSDGLPSLNPDKSRRDIIIESREVLRKKQLKQKEENIEINFEDLFHDKKSVTKILNYFAENSNNVNLTEQEIKLLSSDKQFLHNFNNIVSINNKKLLKNKIKSFGINELPQNDTNQFLSVPDSSMPNDSSASIKKSMDRSSFNSSKGLKRNWQDRTRGSFYTRSSDCRQGEMISKLENLAKYKDAVHSPATNSPKCLKEILVNVSPSKDSFADNYENYLLRGSRSKSIIKPYSYIYNDYKKLIEDTKNRDKNFIALLDQHHMRNSKYQVKNKEKLTTILNATKKKHPKSNFSKNTDSIKDHLNSPFKLRFQKFKFPISDHNIEFTSPSQDTSGKKFNKFVYEKNRGHKEDSFDSSRENSNKRNLPKLSDRILEDNLNSNSETIDLKKIDNVPKDKLHNIKKVIQPKRQFSNLREVLRKIPKDMNPTEVLENYRKGIILQDESRVTKSLSVNKLYRPVHNTNHNNSNVYDKTKSRDEIHR